MMVIWKDPQQNELASNKGEDQLTISNVTEKDIGAYVFTGIFQPVPDINETWNVSGRRTLGKTEDYDYS